MLFEKKKKKSAAEHALNAIFAIFSEDSGDPRTSRKQGGTSGKRKKDCNCTGKRPQVPTVPRKAR